MKHLLVMVLAFVAAGGGVQAEQPSVDTPRWTVQEAAAALEPGWNLGNTLEGVPTEGAWGNPPVTPEVFDRVRSLGFRSVRIPVAFGTHIGGGPDFRIAAGWLSRIEQVVDQALARDLWVLLDFHDYWQTFRNFRKDPSLQTQKFVALWRQLADRFRDKSPKLLFESINEPGSQTPDSDITAAEVNEWNRLFVETVRSTGGGNRTRFLVLPGRNTDGTEAWKTLELPTDPHLMVTFHYYSPWGFVSGSDRTWGSERELAELKGLFDQLKARWSDRGIPVVLGEFGTETGLHPYYMGRWHDAVVREARGHGFSPFFWDNGSWFDRASGTWKDPRVGQAILTASRGAANSFVRSDNVYWEKGQPPAELTFALELNGNRLVSLQAGSQTLVNGTDYTVASDQVRLSEAAVGQWLRASESLRSNLLTFTFSDGAPAQLAAVSYQKPLLSVTHIDVEDRGGQPNRVISADFHGLPVAKITTQTYLDGKRLGVPNYPGNREFAYDDKAKTLTVSGAWVLDKTIDDTLVTFEFPVPGVTCSLWLKAIAEE